jgi:WD repeat-containing protein 61
VSWTQNDTVISVSADGSVKQWSSAAGQPHPPNATFPKPHTLAQVSLSVSPDGKRAIYNSIEGLTSLWNLENGETIGNFESYARIGAEGEPCKRVPSIKLSQSKLGLLFLAWSVSLHPHGETYASTGSSGNVTIHSAGPDNFGQRLSTLTSGRQKFGMFCTHVRRLFLASHLL